MARFDLSKYATVAERLAMLEKAHPDYRLETVDYSTVEDRAKGVWRVRASLYLSREDQLAGLPKAMGHAFEIDGQAGANTTSALENAETSSVGRCLALASASWSGNKDDAIKSLASREEMLKVQRGPVVSVAPEAPADFFDKIKAAETVESLQALWLLATESGYAEFVRKSITDRKAQITGGK
jgi:hypothetical protein